ncbi:MAG: hypothetical protein ABR978_04855 [Dehalococcoidia bacterium]
MDAAVVKIAFFLFGWFCIASTGFAAWQIWKYFDPRWGRTSANVVTALAMIPLLFGGYALFAVLWVTWWLIKRTWLLAARYRKRLAA